MRIATTERAGFEAPVGRNGAGHGGRALNKPQGRNSDFELVVGGSTSGALAIRNG